MIDEDGVRQAQESRARTLRRQALLAYNAYGEQTGWKTYQGTPMPAFADTHPGTQAAWLAAAEASFTAGYRLGYIHAGQKTEPRY